MKAFSACALALAYVFASSVASAKTVAWYHFDERDPGYVMTKDDANVVTNAANAASPVTSSAINSATLTADDAYAGFFPRYEKAPLAPLVYDPVTGERTPNRASMRFVTGRAIMPGTSSYYNMVNGGCLKVSGTDRSCEPTKAITVECFFCTTGLVGNTFAPILGKMKSTNSDGTPNCTSEAWAIYLCADGTMSFRCNCGGTTDHGGTGGKGGQYPRDGGWHHVALVYDGTSKWTLYLDYTAIITKTISAGGEIGYGTSALEEAHAIYIGGYPYKNGENGYRKFEGCIDEVRVSDEALGPEKFLRLREQDPDVVARFRFDPPNEQGMKITQYGNYNSLLDYKGWFVNPGTVGTAPAASSFVRESMSADKTDNSGAVNMLASSASKTNAHFSVPDAAHIVRQGANRHSCTVEAFFKTNGRIRGTNNKRTVFKFGTTPVVGFVLEGMSDYVQAICTYNLDGTWKGVYRTVTCDDSQWHHVAVVNDDEVRQVRYYLDGALIKVVNLGADHYVSIADGHALYVGNANSDDQQFQGWIDEVRLTKRVLYPDEFLNANAVKAAEGKALAFFNFENDYATSVNADLIGEGEGLKHGAGAAPTFSAWPKGGLLMDGTAEGQTPLANTTWLNFQDSLFGVKNYTPLFVQKDFTVEFIAKFTELKNNANLVRFANGTSDYNADPIWALYRNKGDASGKQLQARIQMVNNGSSASSYDFTANLDTKIDDGRLHHYALTFETKSGPKTEVRLYRDYVQKGSKTINGTVDFARTDSTGTNLNGRLCFGASGKDNTVTGFVDALRFSKGVLSTNEFMRLEKLCASIFIR